MGEQGKEKKKRRFSWKLFIAFMVFEIIFTGITGPFNLYYGPFENVKKTVVGTAMSTYTHRWIATLFLSDDKIKDILKEETVEQDSGKATVGTVEQDTTEIKVPVTHNNDIVRHDLQAKKFDFYILEIKDPSRVKVGYTSKLQKEGQRTSTMAKEKGAVAAMNGGGFTDKSPDGRLWAGTGAFPTGILISDGKVVYSGDIKDNFEKRNVMGLTKDGVLIVGEHNINGLLEKGVTEAISFDPPLIINGIPQIKGDGGQGTQPRTAIGQKKDGTILLLVVDGRQGLKVGASLKEVQEIMIQYGAWNATNLDGGSSSTMYYDGEIINSPCDPLGERSVATCVYVKP